MCGEHHRLTIFPHRTLGSSPRVRGTLGQDPARGGYPGIIPACAGNTTWISSLRSMARDHPRVCGEHKSVCTPPTSCSGSSPRVRGTRRGPVQERVQRGIIPACAGNTGAYHNEGAVMRDHPRVCGEHIVWTDDNTGLEESSPRVRGTQQLVKTVGDIVGIIPACAGNTFSFSWP